MVCGWVAFAVYSSAAEGRALDSQVSRLRQENAGLQQQIDERRRELAQSESKAWLEEQARKLGYVLPGETVYVIATPGPGAPSRGGVDAPLPTYSPSPTAAQPARVAPKASASPSLPPLVVPH